MLSVKIKFNPISNNMRRSSSPFFSWSCVVCIVFMDVVDLFCKGQIQMFLVIVLFPLTLTLSDIQKPLTRLVKNNVSLLYKLYYVKIP